MFDASGFVNPISRNFGWSLDPPGHCLSLTYVPSAPLEPSAFGLVFVGLFTARRG